MKIAVVIPIVFSSKKKLYEKAIKSLVDAWQKVEKHSSDKLEFVLVFNLFPANHSLPKIRVSGCKISILTQAINKGFTGAVNDGCWFATYQRQADWCLVINDDAWVDSVFFSKMLPNLKKSLAVVACGVKNLDGSAQSIGLSYQKTGHAQPVTTYKPTPFFVGTAFFVAADTIRWSFENFGWLLANFFFAYAEDLELSLRLLRFGKKVQTIPELLVTHTGSVTAGKGSAQQLFWGYRNLCYVMALHWRISWVWRLLPQLIWGQIYVIGMLLWKGHWLVYPKILWAICKNRKILKLYREKIYEKAEYSYPF